MKGIRIRLRCHNMNLPISYNHLLHGLIYKMFSTDPDFSSFIHDEGVDMYGQTYRPFTFTRLTQLDGKSLYNREDKSLTYNQLVEFEVRSVEDYAIDVICAYLENNHTVQIGWHVAEVVGYTVFQTRHFGDAHYIRMISPLTIHAATPDGKSHYFEADSEEFYERIVANGQKKFLSIAQKTLDFIIYPEKVKPSDRSLTYFHTTPIVCFRGIYRIEGDPEIIDFLYYTGLGDRNSQGFGVFEFDDGKKIR